MASPSFKAELFAEVERLETSDQRRVLAFARTLATSRPRGVSGADFIKRIQELRFDPELLEQMERAIEEDCERVDSDDW